MIRLLDYIITKCEEFKEYLIEGLFLKVRVLVNGQRKMLNKLKTLINNNDTDNTGNTNTKYENIGELIWISKH